MVLENELSRQLAINNELMLRVHRYEQFEER